MAVSEDDGRVDFELGVAHTDYGTDTRIGLGVGEIDKQTASDILPRQP
ncbi:MAG: hypothetical protein F6K54_27170 [Okeania sp. SIO3B5]|nr:hypothetical protein [Okeania sp. SIO3B5]NEO56442.1 hypothetical protein [Okeania sp. SIO3B5]